MELNEAQSAIIAAPVDEQMVVLAGPGSGKTTVLVRRITALIRRGILPRSIAVVTFTNQAARELEKRLEIEFKPFAPHNAVAPKLGYIGTIHGLCLQLLQFHGQPRGWKRSIAVLDDERSNQVLRETADLVGYTKLSLSKIIEARDQYGSLAEEQPVRTPAMIAVAHYYRKLRSQQAIDFRGLLSEGLEILRIMDVMDQPRLFTHLLVDEYQDCTDEDVEIFNHLRAPVQFLVGDPDQAIYSFRGGDIFHIIARATDNSDTLRKLELNYRSAPLICETAQSLIENNEGRVQKSTVAADLSAQATIDVQCFDNDALEAAWIANDIMAGIQKIGSTTEIAVLSRTNAIADKLRKMLQAFGIKTEANVQMKDMEGWKLGRAILGLLAAPDSDLAVENYMQLRNDSAYVKSMMRQTALDKTSISKIFQKDNPPKWNGDLAELPSLLSFFGCDPEVLAQLCEFAKDQLPQQGADLNDLILALRYQHARERRGDGVAVLTMHAAKGREWDTVYIAGLEDQVIPGHAAKNIEEERRLLYVAITRAKRHLILSHVKSRAQSFPPYAQQLQTPSRFLAELH